MMCFNVNVFISRFNMGVYGLIHFWSQPQEAVRGTTVFGISALASLFSPGTGCHLFSTHALLCLLSYALSFTTYTQRGAHEIKVN